MGELPGSGVSAIVASRCRTAARPNGELEGFRPPSITGIPKRVPKNEWPAYRACMESSRG